MLDATCKKSTQAINYFARKKGGINKMKAIKLIYLADRYHLRKYGRPIVGDFYYAMKLGPVGSVALDVANQNEGLGKECTRYIKQFIERQSEGTEDAVISKKEVDLDVFSQTDIEAFEAVYKEFGGQDQFELAKMTHLYPEWSKFEDEIVSGRKRSILMDYADFFKNAPKQAGIFELPSEHLIQSKGVFEENEEAEKMLG